ncbi:MAG: GAF domain-containing protein [Bacteroidota bacterium]
MFRKYNYVHYFMPLREIERLQAVNRFLKLEISKENELQAIVELAAKICGTPVALITMIDDETQFIKFKIGTDLETTAREQAFCNEVIKHQEIMVIPDALLDKRFCNNPHVAGDCGVRFYAGAPLTTKDGFNLGSLCVVDGSPKELTELQQEMLVALSRQVIQLLEFDISVTILKEQFVEAKRSEIELRSFFESSIDCHLLLGRNSEVLTFNKALERLVKRTYGHTLKRGDLMSAFLSPEIRNTFYLHYQNALKGKATNEERKVDYQDGRIWWVIKYEPAYGPDGEIIGVSVNSSDITSRVIHQEKVSAQNASLNEIAFIQSHELRRPVASILGLLNLLEIDERATAIEEFYLMKKAVEELDEKIRLVVGYTAAEKAEA